MARYEDIQEISREGFQVVSGECFQKEQRINAPTVTVWPDSICFSKTSLLALNNCERVRIEVNPAIRCMLVIPVTEKDKDNVRWVKNVKDPAARKIECMSFTKQLYDGWEWNTLLAYRTPGRIVTSDKKVMLLFDFNAPHSFKYKVKAKAN